jgi:hypothetical protein
MKTSWRERKTGEENPPKTPYIGILGTSTATAAPTPSARRHTPGALVDTMRKMPD